MLQQISREAALAELAPVRGLKRISREEALSGLAASIRALVLAAPGVDARIEGYRDGEVSFADLMATPVWRRFVRKAMRQRATASWVDEEDLMQELQIIVFEAYADPAKSPRAFDPSRSSSLSKFVVHQIPYWLRDLQRKQTNTLHRKGAKPRVESLIVDNDSTVEKNQCRSRDRRMNDGGVGTIPASQEQTVARKFAIEGLDERVRAAVVELFDSGSIDRALAKVGGKDERDRRKSLNVAVATVLRECDV